MKNNSSLRCLQLVKRNYKRGLERAYTPSRLPPNKSPINLQNRTPSPDSVFKVQNTIHMYECIRRSFSPKKKLESLPETNLNLNSKDKTLSPIGEITRISLKDYGVGNDYATALSNTVKSLNNLKELNIRSNRIADEGAFNILTSLRTTNIRVLDISSNSLGINSIHVLVELLESFNSNLQKLSLENTKLNLFGLEKLVVALRDNRCLEELNLANNKLSSGSGAQLKELLSMVTALKKLDLHWNLIRGIEAVLFFQGLCGNDSLIAVDISWNSLGNNQETTDSLCNFLMLNTQLSHLDISNNRFSYSDCYAISEAIKSNHNLIGCHIEGNNCKIDHLGYINPMSEISRPIAMQKSARILRSPRRINDNNCWVCNSYVDFHIKWNPEAIQWNRKLKNMASFALRSSIEPVFVHLDIDDYNPFRLVPDDQGVYSALRAVQSERRVSFFFSYRGYPQISHEYPIEPLQNPITKMLKLDSGEIKEITSGVVNYFFPVKGELTCKARPIVEPYKIGSYENSLNESEWSFDKSIFAAGYKWDSEVYAT